MDKLLPVINKLQDVFHSVGMLDTIDLPQIAVVGSQSSGKSSVLENIVGRDFLPRGTGIVTRRPLVLQLTNVTLDKNSKDPQEWGEFLHIPKKKFYDFNEIRDEIVADTERVTGKNKGISELAIHLKIYSPNVLNLTLVDLPGITKIPVGDQPKDIEYQIKAMVLKYIKNPNCIILAVSPANSDLANSESLKLAREVDKKGNRTLGVLTKLDLMDRGTDALDVLQGKVYYLRRGFIGVVNRGQQDINGGKSIKDALKSEDEYFLNHPSYKSIASRLGTPYLAKTLNTILLNHIRSTLPSIKTKVQSLIVQAQERLSKYGDELSESTMSQGALLLQLVTKFSTKFIDVIDGKSTDLSNNSLFGGARINHIFTKKFTPYLIKLDACENLTEEDIKMSITNAKGPRTSLFIPEASFDMLVKKQVKHLENPSLHCVDQVLDELLSIVDLASKDLLRFPNLKEKVKELTIELLRAYTIPLKEFIKNLISIELAYINTNHPDFFGGGSQAIQLISGLSEKKKQVDNENDSNYTISGRKPKESKPEPKKTENVSEKDSNEWSLITPPKGYEKPLNDVKKVVGNVATQVVKEVVKEEVSKRKKNFLTSFFGVNYDKPEAKKEEVVKKQNVVQQLEEEKKEDEKEEQEEEEQEEQEELPSPKLTDLEKFEQSTVSREEMELRIIRSLLTSYFGIVRKGIADSVPKSVMHFLVNKSKQNIQSELVRKMYKDELFKELLKENDDIAQKRKVTQKMLKVLQRAQQVLNEVRDLRL